MAAGARIGGLLAREQADYLARHPRSRALYAAGVGIKFQISHNVLFRADFRDYITTFPRQIIVPAPNGTDRGLFSQFTPTVGLSYTIQRHLHP